MKLHRFLPFPLAAAIAIAAMLASPANATPVTTGLALWLDAGDATTMTIDVSGVAEWRDKNGSAAKMTRRAGTPTVEATGIGGIPTVRFNNSSRMNDGVNHAAPVTIFYVSRQTGGSNQRVLGATSNNWLLGYWNGKKGSAYFDGGVLLDGNGPSDTAPHLYAATIRGSGQNSTVWAEGVQIVSNQNGTQGPNNLQLNGYQNGGELSNCDISEVLLYNRILDANELLAVGGYLTAKYSLTTSYPTGLTVSLTSPANNQAYVSGTSVSATADAVFGTAPRTVKFFTRSLPSGTFAQAGADDTTAPYTVDLGALSDGSYEIYTTATDSATTPATSTSAISTFTVAPAQTTTTTVVSSGSPSIYGNSVTFTATVSPAPTGGSVQFSNGVDPVGSPVAVNTTTGVATFTTTTLGVGTAEITAEYSGYQIYETSDSALASISQVVTKAPLTVTASNSIRSINSANPTFTYQITGYKNSQTYGASSSGVTGTPSLSTTATSSSPAGAYPITCALGTLAASNYSFTLVNGTLTIVATDTPEVVTLIDSIALASPNSWGGIAVTNPSSNIAITGAGPLTLGASGINMATSTVNLTLGAPITLGASQTWNAGSGRTLEATGIISGSSMGLTKAGLGTLTLKGANTYDGTTIVNGGTLTLNRQTGSLNGSTGTALTFGGTGTFNMDNVGASGALTQNLGTLTFSAGDGTVKTTRTAAQNEVLTFASLTARAAGATGNFVHGGGTNSATNGFTLTSTTNAPLSTDSNNPGLFFGGTEYARYDAGGFFRATAYGTDTNALATVATGATIGVDDAAKDVKITGAITAQTTAAVNTLNLGANAFTLTAGNTLSVNGLLSTNTLTFGAVANQGAIQATADGGEIVVNTSAVNTTLTLNSVIQNFSGGSLTSALTKSGLGTLTLSGTNLYTGGTTINAGTISLATAASLGSGPIAVDNGGTLGAPDYEILNRNFTLNGGGLHLYMSTISGTITLAANSSIYADGANFSTSTINAPVSGVGGLTQNGPGRAGVTLLTGTNTYNGPTVINNGALIVKSSLYDNDTTKWTPANITVASNAVLGMSVGGASDFTMAQAATMFTNLTTGVNNNGMRPNSFMSLDTRNASAGTYTFSSVLTDSTGPGGGAVNFESNGSSNTTLELTGANTYSGVTMVRNNGTLRVSSLNSVFTNPTLGTVHSASSSLGAPTTVANGTILLGESNWNGNQYPGTSYQSGNLTYTGTGETTDRVIFLGGYSGTRTYTLDQSGTGLLKFLSNFDQQIANTNHNLILAGSTTGTGEIAGAIANNNTGFNNLITKNGTGTWTLSGANTYAGVTTVTGGALVLANATAIPGGIGATGGLSALTFNGGVIGLGVGNFSRPLAAVNTVTGVNFTGNGGWAAYGADRTVNLGGAAASVTWATANTGLNGRTLILGNATATHTVDFQNPLDMTNGNRTVQVDNGAAVIDGKLSGAITGIAGGNLIKTGLGTLSLTGTNNYVGTTTVSGGTLALGASNVLPDVSAVTIGNATLDADAFTDTAGTLDVTGAATINLGTGTLAFGGSSAVDWTGGTLNVTGTLGATSLRFGTTSGGLAPAQLALISVNGSGLGTYTLDASGYLVTGGSPYDTWANGYLPGADVSNKAGNNDGDSLTNLQEFAFGTQPTVSTGEIVYSGGTLTTPGAPKIVAAAGTYSMVFGRRADYVAAGLTYTVQFSADLITWVDNDDVANVPVQVATDETINVMSVPFVNFIDTPSGPRKPTFARVKVTMP